MPDQTARTQEAFAALVKQHARLLFRVAYGVLRNSHDAEDAVQEAFLKLYRGEAWKAMKDEKAFLARTVWRVALDRSKATLHPLRDISELNLPSPDTSPEELATASADSRLLRRMIDALPADLRAPLILVALEELNSREVGVVLNLPEATVRTRLMRARAELKKRFASAKEGRR